MDGRTRQRTLKSANDPAGELIERGGQGRAGGGGGSHNERESKVGLPLQLLADGPLYRVCEQVREREGGEHARSPD